MLSSLFIYVFNFYRLKLFFVSDFIETVVRVLLDRFDYVE